jgi:uncharacterized protein (DUF2236 family)
MSDSNFHQRTEGGQPLEQPVEADQIEACLARVAARKSDPNAGIFGPSSISWRINRESALFLAAGRAALLQLAHPWVATALTQHSSLLAKPIARFHNTFRVVFTMIFGSLDQATSAARHLYQLHTRIKGELPQDAAQWRRGSHYQANEVAALRWVFATLVESAVLAYECAVAPLSPPERDRYYAESKILASLFGIPTSALPENWRAFVAYNQAMHASDQLGVTDSARAMSTQLLAGAGSWIKPPAWYRALTADWLPERLRRDFAIAFDEKQQRAAARARHRLPRIYQHLPRSLRFTGPWREANARLADRHPGPLTRWSNSFWIGQPLLPFGNRLS